MTYEDLNRFKNIEELKTKRLVLRKLRPSDESDVYLYASDARVTRYLLWSPHKDVYDTRRYLRFIERKYKRAEMYDWGIEYQGHIIGTCGFSAFSIQNNSAEIGYVLRADCWGMGIAAEALSAVLEYGFSKLSLNRIEGKFMYDNTRSLSVMQKCKMTFEGVAKSQIFVKGKYRDVGTCAILKSEYEHFKNLGTL